MTTRREALVSAAVAGSIAALLAWLGPPGSDLAAHAYQRTLFLEHGFQLWNNFWYAGRYSFVTYSILYYPLAALLGIKLLAVATVALASLAFTAVVAREWGPPARWSSRTFAVVWAGIVLSAAFPFALGMALALVALWALQSGARWRFAALAILTLLASPVAFLLLLVILGGVALTHRPALVPIAAAAFAVLVEVVLWRLFPGGGTYPFSPAELAAIVLFCLLGIALTWHVERVLCAVFCVYLVVVIGAYLVPSAIGENVARMRYAAIPLAVLIFSLRRWQPRFLGVVVVALAVAFNVSPLAASFVKGAADPTTNAQAWRGAVAFLHTHLSPAYRVEAVDTATHWPELVLAEANIPLARGWFRQDDFPQNEALYDNDLGMHAYLGWLRGLGVRYVVRANAATDYSSRREATLARRLPVVYRDTYVTVYSVPHAEPIARGLQSLSGSKIRIAVTHPGYTRIAVRYSPYWHASEGCLRETSDGMLLLSNRTRRVVTIVFDVNAHRVLQSLEGERHQC
ncbi:MAG: hypothetical protein ABUS54_14940 [Actinomycetota bacterium]